MKETQIIEKRKSARWKTSRFFSRVKKSQKRYFNVVNESNNESIGHLVDLSPDGLKTIGGLDISRTKPMSLKMELPREMNDVKEVSFVAQCTWCAKDAESELYLAGYKIISISPSARKVLETIVAE